MAIRDRIVKWRGNVIGDDNWLIRSVTVPVLPTGEIPVTPTPPFGIPVPFTAFDICFLYIEKGQDINVRVAQHAGDGNEHLIGV